MKIYSDFPLRRALQIGADVLALVVIGLGVWAGVLVATAIGVLAGVGEQLEQAGTGFKGAMTDAGEALGGIPLIGDAARGPFDAASGTGGMLEDAGRTVQSVVLTSAAITGTVVAGVIVFAVVWVWLRRRLLFIRRATEAVSLARLGDGHDLLALRALVHGERRDLAAVGANPVAAWRSGEPSVIARLAELELREAGVRLSPAAAR